MVKEHNCEMCREVFKKASEIAGHIRHHESEKYREEVEASCDLLVEQTPLFPIAGQRNERQAQGGSGYTGLASPPLHELGNLYLSESRSNLNSVDCSAPAEGSRFKSNILRVLQDYPVISSADSLRFQPQDPWPQGSDSDSGLSLDVHHGGNFKPVDTYTAPSKRKGIILEPPQKYPVVSSADKLRFSPGQQIRPVENFEHLLRNDIEKFQQEEDIDLIYFPSDSIQNSIREGSLQFQQQRDHYLQHSSSHDLQNVVRRGAQPFQQLDLISPSSESVLTDLKDVSNADSEQFKQPKDHNFLHSSYDFQPAADLFFQQAPPGKLENVLGLIPEQFQQQCDDMFPYLTGGLNDIFENGSLIFELERDQTLPDNVDRGSSKYFQQTTFYTFG